MERTSGDFDILVVGAGVLGVTIAYWLSGLFDCKIALVDAARAAGMHTTSRNTGVVHRPFYLDPTKKRIFALTSKLSYPMWKRLAQSTGLPWTPAGTFNVAVEEHELGALEQYLSWGPRNGMEEGELELMDGNAVRALEPEVECRAALLSKTDVSVDFGALTRHLWRVLTSKGVRFFGNSGVVSVRAGRGGFTEMGIRRDGRLSSVRCRLLVNAAGGGSIDIAHASGLALNYAALNFRGEYWVVDEPFASRITSNIYRPPRFPQFPFLDPHFVVRADGSRQIGPNAVMIPGPYVYWGAGLTRLLSFLDRPIEPKVRLMTNQAFLSLLAKEWRSSLSKRVMCGRVGEFIPGLKAQMLNRRAVFGVRSSLIDAHGFVPEALLVTDDRSAHILNYNSPGATGAPSYSAMVVARLHEKGLLDEFQKKAPHSSIWDFEEAAGLT